MAHAHDWAIVLAAGEGTRLRELTTQFGVATPKQYCSLRGGRSLLGDALARAARIVPRKRIVVIVAEEHRCFWEPELRALLPENIIVQPENRGTAAGILLPLLTVLERDPGARLAFLPSDHFVAKEYVIEASLRLALESLDDEADGITLLGITPEGPDSGYGWIVPAESDRLLRPVDCFVEKPPHGVSLELFAAGALWNSFLFAVKGSTLLRTYAERLPRLEGEFRRAFELEGPARTERIAELYAGLETCDFSRSILQGGEQGLRLEVVPPCGWTDLGTPERVEACVANLPLAGPEKNATTAVALDLALALRGFSRAKGSAAAMSA